MKKLLIVLCAAAVTCVYAEEGMWPFNMIPVENIEKTYGIRLEPDWIEKVQKSSLRISVGGSGSFVSPYGLVMTNHHVGHSAIHHLSTQEEDLVAKGFYASSLDQELKCPNVYVEELVEIRDVTNEVNRDAANATSSGEREKARTAAIADIKKKAKEETGLQPEVVTLYHGARYDLYLYKRYTDVRLVMAPEKAIAYFGGDNDNFEYPRYSLDVCFLRVYENNQPLQPEHFLKWSAAGPKGEEGIFVSGHPGKTERLLTSDHLKFVQDLELPLFLQALDTRRQVLHEFAAKSAENKRIADDSLATVENSYKALSGIYQGFSTVPVIREKVEYEQKLYGSTDSDNYKPWKQIKTALDQTRSFYPDYWVMEGRGSRYDKLFMWAKRLVRAAEEKAKPNDKRLKEYTDTELPSFELSLFSTEPVYKDLEIVLLADGLMRLIRIMGSDDPVVMAVLNGKTPEERAKELITGTRLGDLQYRKDLYNSASAVLKSNDPLILFAKMLDPYARDLRQKYENECESVLNEGYAEISKITFARYGESIYPDATFTLRLAMGRMKGYEENGAAIPPWTTLAGAYQHAKVHGDREPYKLPSTWMDKENAINKRTPLDFVLTNDITGGNSGSPVVNGKGEVVGLIFDSNKQGLIWDYQFDEVQGRAVAVHSQGIIEALKTIYGTLPLVKEIREGTPPPSEKPTVSFLERLKSCFSKKTAISANPVK